MQKEVLLRRCREKTNVRRRVYRKQFEDRHTLGHPLWSHSLGECRHPLPGFCTRETASIILLGLLHASLFRNEFILFPFKAGISRDGSLVSCLNQNSKDKLGVCPFKNKFAARNSPSKAQSQGVNHIIKTAAWDCCLSDSMWAYIKQAY